MNGAFKGLNTSDVYLTSYISKKRWQADSGSFENLGISKTEAASGSSTYGSLRMSYYEGSLPSSGSFSGSYDLNLQSTLTLQGGRRLPYNILAYSIPRECFGENIEAGSFYLEGELDGESCSIWDQEGLLLTTTPVPEVFRGFLEKLPEFKEDVAGLTLAIPAKTGNAYRVDFQIPEDGDWSGLETAGFIVDEADMNIANVFISSDKIDWGSEDPASLVNPEFLDNKRGSFIRIILDSLQDTLHFSWLENGSRAWTPFYLKVLDIGETRNSYVVGDIIYNKGIVLLDKDKLDLESETLSWTSIKTINTWNVNCKVKDLEYNYSYNGTIAGSNQELMGTSKFTPYITAVGLYNRTGELMAVAKLSQPIRKNDNIDITFKVNIDIS